MKINLFLNCNLMGYPTQETEVELTQDAATILYAAVIDKIRYLQNLQVGQEHSLEDPITHKICRFVMTDEMVRICYASVHAFTTADANATRLTEALNKV